MTTRFKIRAAASCDVARIKDELKVPEFIARTLVNRGIDTPDKAEQFMHPRLDRDWGNPRAIKGMNEVVDALERAIRAREHVVVFGDFDLDGISATTVLTRGIRALGGRATPFIPRRFDEGYGLSAEAYARVKKLDPDLIVTVDCGISCKDEVKAIVDDGITVLITDHHEVSDNVPVDVPICDPKMVEGSPESILAGVGVALKVVQALGSRFGFPHLWRSYTDFAALGTIADLMPMVGENRALVSDGITRLNENPRPCIAALKEACGMEGKQLSSTNISFSLAPRLNAAGRMGDATGALDLLMSDSYADSVLLAKHLEKVNDLRREKEAELSQIAKEQAQKTYHGERILIVAGEGWHEGIKGIVASRLVALYGVPTILFTIDGDQARGSGRSVGNVNLFKAVESAADLLTKFGGHGAAVGLTLPAKNLPAFQARMIEYMNTLPQSEFEPMISIDCSVSLAEFTLDNVAQIDVLAPFGQENPEPVFLARNVLLENSRAVGADKTHLSCQLTDGRSSVSAILFHCSDIEKLMFSDTVIDAVFTAQIDEWRGRFTVKAMLKALVPARCCSAIEAMMSASGRKLVDKLFDEALSSPAEITAHMRSSARCCRKGEGCRSQRKRWERLAQDDPDALAHELVRAIIGDAPLHEAQVQILKRLSAGHSTLGVMATGRGKSLIFQVYAALLALKHQSISVFVYPLRSLMADQAFHIAAQFERFGLTCAVLNGECTDEERERIYAGISEGAIDIVLTTPEFLSFHAERIARSGRVGFMVIDEAHHIGQAKAGNRDAYRKLDAIRQELGNPVVLALTATAPDDIAHDIYRTLSIDESVIDDASRDNLHLDDQRGIKNKDDYLAHIVAQGQKCIIYVNARDQSVGVARRLRRRVPQYAVQIGFYHAGLSRQERNRIEELFRKGELQVLVATSAFGEGIDIPDIRHVVLYHMPFSDVEFNQMSGRAGRDGNDAWIHLLYGKQDASINEGLLNDMTPCRDIMAKVYRSFRCLQSECPGKAVRMCVSELARKASDDFCLVSPEAIECGLAVFNELGLINVMKSFDDAHEIYEFTICENAPKVELTDSVRYREGLDELAAFHAFRDWAMRSDGTRLAIRITHPITPSHNDPHGKG